MVKFRRRPEEIDFDGYLLHKNKICIARRKANGKIYDSPQIVLDSKFKEFIGKHYIAVAEDMLEDVITYPEEGKVSVKSKRTVIPCITLYIVDDVHYEDVDTKQEFNGIQDMLMGKVLLDRLVKQTQEEVAAHNVQ